MSRFSSPSRYVLALVAVLLAAVLIWFASFCPAQADTFPQRGAASRVLAYPPGRIDAPACLYSHGVCVTTFYSDGGSSLPSAPTYWIDAGGGAIESATASPVVIDSSGRVSSLAVGDGAGGVSMSLGANHIISGQYGGSVFGVTNPAEIYVQLNSGAAEGAPTYCDYSSRCLVRRDDLAAIGTNAPLAVSGWVQATSVDAGSALIGTATMSSLDAGSALIGDATVGYLDAGAALIGDLNISNDSLVTQSGSSIVLSDGLDVNNGGAGVIIQPQIARSAGSLFNVTDYTDTKEFFTVGYDGTIRGDGAAANGMYYAPVVQSYFTSATHGIDFQSSSVALAGGAATVTFSAAYSATPFCTCSDATASNSVQCSPDDGGASLFIAGTGTDTVDWICLGPQ